MNHELEYHNHKNRLTSLRQEVECDRLAYNSDLRIQKSSPLSTVLIQKLANWMSQVKTWRAAKTETTVDYNPSLQQE